CCSLMVAPPAVVWLRTISHSTDRATRLRRSSSRQNERRGRENRHREDQQSCGSCSAAHRCPLGVGCVIANTYHKTQKRSRRSMLPVGDYGRLLADAGVGMFMRATGFAILLLGPMAAAGHSASGAEPVGIVFDLTGPA